jgi:hypothetical protein
MINQVKVCEFCFWLLYSNNCHIILINKKSVCKYVTNEISDSLLKHKSHELIETAYSIDERLDKKKAKKYMDS